MAKKTILIVDDTFENLYLLRVILEEAGYNVIEATNGSEGLEMLHKNNNVSLIVSDILMPVMDGYLFCQACKKEEQLAKIPFVFYTSTYTEKLDEDFGLKLGAAHFLRKPIEHDQLLFAVNNILNNVKANGKELVSESRITEGEVLKLYSERLINKLEQKSLDLGNEVEERKKAEQLLIQKNEILDLIAVNTPLNKIFEKLLLNYQAIHPNYYGAISLLEEDGEHLTLQSAPSMPKTYNSALKRVAIGPKVGSCGTAAFIKKPVIVSNIGSDKLWEDYKDLASQYNLKSCWSLPILSKQNKVLGTFAIYSKSINTPSLDEVRELNFAVSLANIAIEKFRASEEIKKKDESYKALVDQATDAIVTYSLDGTIYSFNKATYVGLGYTKKEFLKLKLQDFLIGDIIINQDNHKKILKGEATTFIRRLKHKNKSVIIAEISARLQKDGKLLAIVRDITEWQNNLKELKLTKEFSENLINSMQNGLSVIDTNKKHIHVNPALCKITGYSEKELLGKYPPFPYWPPEYYDEINNIVEKTLLGIDVSGETVFKRKNGERFPVQITISRVKDDRGIEVAFFASIEDISVKVKARDELKAAKEFTDKLIMSMQEGLLIAGLDTKIIMVNESLCKITGYSNQELMGLPHPYPFWKQEDHDSVLNRYSEVAQEKAKEVYYDVVKKNGKVIKASFFTGTIKDDKGEVIALYATIKDISEEEKAKKILEEKARVSNQKKTVILELASLVGKDFASSLKKITELAAKTLNVKRVSIWSFNQDQKEINCEKLYVIGEGNTKTNLKIKYEDNPNYFNALIKNQTILINDAQNNTITKLFTKNYLKPNNITSLMDVFVNSTTGYYGIICFEHVGNSLRNWTPEDQEFATSIASIVSLMVESTERKVAEAELKTEKEFSEELITSLNEGLSVVDLNGVHIKVNEALCKMTGFTEDELVGIKAPFPYWPPERYDVIYKAFNDPLNNMGINKEAVLMRKNGERFPVTLSDSIIKNEKGEVMAYFTTITDITYRVKAENILKENVIISNQRKNTIIELAKLIGEDFNASLEKIAIISAKALNVDLVTIWKYQNNKTELLSRLFYDANESRFDIEGLVIKKENFPNYFNAFNENNSINITNVSDNPITKAFAKEYFIENKIYSRIDILIYGRNDYYGIISFESASPEKVFTNEEESFATSIASIVTLMVESKQRRLAEGEMAKTNELLVKANAELTELRNQLEQENVYLRNELDLVFNYEEMVYGSEAFSNVLSEVEKVSPTNATVLLLGESGTGKELLARAIHNTSLRNNKPLIKVNCSAIPRELIESELFGHKKGSFTGAFNDKIGKFELADGGTLFLDEIGEMPLDMQPKILRFLQEGEIEVIGGGVLKKLDVRVIAATNRNLVEEIEKKQFREDLYFRLNVFPINVPPLRKRKNDIPLLVEHFVDKFNKAYDKNIKFISDDSMSQLISYSWPGNIRELENLIERASILSTNDTLLIPGFESATQEKAKHYPIKNKDLSFETAQRNHILHVIEQCNWKITGEKGASTLLGLKPSTLRDKMKKLGIVKPNKK